MPFKYTTKSALQTKSIGRGLAKKIIKNGPQKKAVVLGLIGNLGGGKTTFIQGFAGGLGIKEKILSPTFVVMRKFKINVLPAEKLSPYFENFYHIDCYRTQRPNEILSLGLKNALDNPQNIIAIEWAEKINSILPKDIFKLRFHFVNKSAREITIHDSSKPN